ncbi:hypothetical protein Pmani_013970 [Petrolisthes manimaculis]|uniref:Methyltransferase domain-containing protein n=1 Tax=Petrolisthes manimaculis TaxID=1843537 RepID=A0AAE1PUX2_9EUCA|nr:hypothetical protein Pmani_013970 [Petrolisthes manimaculis]
MEAERKYLEDVVQLLQNVSWLYNFPLTQIFTRNVFKEMPKKWREVLFDLPLDVLNSIPQSISKVPSEWPLSLQNFLEECRRLSVHQLLSNYPSHSSSKAVQIPPRFVHKISAKKKHEVAGVLRLVKNLAERTSSTHILDIGSGKGYIDSCLHETLKLTIVGAESEEKLVSSATERQTELAGQCPGVKHFIWSLADDEATLNTAREVIENLVKVKQPCTCFINTCSRCQSLDSKQSVHVKKCSCCRKNMAQGTEVDHTLSVERITVYKDTPGVWSALALSKSGNSLNNSCMLLGLHACADLSPIIMKMFRVSSQASSLVLLSCCYHKLKSQKKDSNMIGGAMTDKNEKLERVCSADPVRGTGSLSQKYGNGLSNEENIESHSCQESSENEISDISADEFLNFPMSQTLRGILDQHQYQMTVFGLRLGAQESGLKWQNQTPEQHECHWKNVAFRGLLEVFCQQEGLTLKKCRRRCARKSLFVDLRDYAKTIKEHYEFVDTPQSDTVQNSESGFENSEELISKALSNLENVMEKDYERHKHLFPLIEPFTGLQLALQPVIEGLVLLDRVTFLRECGFTNVWLEKVFKDELSPRNVALVALR